MLRTLAGAEPEVTRAEAKLSSPKVDRSNIRVIDRIYEKAGLPRRGQP
jgi:hypothetical protein